MQFTLILDERPKAYDNVTFRFEVVTEVKRTHLLSMSDTKQLKDKERKKTVLAYAAGFAMNTFGPCGEAIVVSVSGKVLNGVKVLTAADREFVRLFIHGLPDSTHRKTCVRSNRNDMASHPDFVPPLRPDPGTSLQDFADALNAGTDPRYPTVHATYLTPEMAAPMVRATSRRITPGDRRIVDGMIHDLRAGLWEATGDTVVCTASMVLLDGLLRAIAVVESGVKMPVILVRNAHPGFAPTFGSGMSTNLGDRLYAWGYNQPWAITAALKRFAWWAYGDPDLKPSLGQMCKMLDDHAAIVNSVKPTYHARKVMNPRISILLHYCLRAESPDETDAFFKAFRIACSPRSKGERHPVAVRLRDRLLATGLPKNSNPNLDRIRFRYVIQAWKAFGEGRLDVRFKDGEGLPPLRVPKP